jgi:phage portal protein BeeE
LSLRYPNETTSSDGFIRSMFKDFLIFDNAYALLTPAANGQITLVRMPAHMVVVEGRSLFDADVTGCGRRARTSCGAATASSVDFTPDQIMHWHGEHPLDPRIGLSHLDTLRT